MKRRTPAKRGIHPAVATAMVATVSWVLYNVAWRLGHPALHRVLSNLGGTLLFLSVAFGALYVYPASCFRGAGPGERVLASLFTPWLWATKECIRLYAAFSFSQCLYYYLNPLNVWLLFGLIAEMGLAELYCRWRTARREAAGRVRFLGPLTAAAFGLFMVAFLISWGQGENAYVIFLKGFRMIFGSGL